jgi:hypothetical protein
MNQSKELRSVIAKLRYGLTCNVNRHKFSRKNFPFPKSKRKSFILEPNLEALTDSVLLCKFLWTCLEWVLLSLSLVDIILRQVRLGLILNFGSEGNFFIRHFLSRKWASNYEELILCSVFMRRLDLYCVEAFRVFNSYTNHWRWWFFCNSKSKKLFKIHVT